MAFDTIHRVNDSNPNLKVVSSDDFVARYVQGLSGNATVAAKNLTRVEAALERETSALRSGLHSVQQISAHLKGQVSLDPLQGVSSGCW